MFNMYLHIHSISKNPSNTRTLQFICYLCIYPKHEEKLVHQAELLIGRLGPSINGEIKWQSQYLKWLVTFHGNVSKYAYLSSAAQKHFHNSETGSMGTKCWTSNAHTHTHTTHTHEQWRGGRFQTSIAIEANSSFSLHGHQIIRIY